MRNINRKKYTGILIAIIMFIFSFGAITVYAQYVPLAPLPGVGVGGGATTLSNYLESIFKIGIGLAGVFAVLMIIIAGIEYIGGAASPSARSDARKRITNALLGLILALGAWLILNTINPALLNKGLNVTPVAVPVPAPAGAEAGALQGAPFVNPDGGNADPVDALGED